MTIDKKPLNKYLALVGMVLGAFYLICCLFFFEEIKQLRPWYLIAAILSPGFISLIILAIAGDKWSIKILGILISVHFVSLLLIALIDYLLLRTYIILSFAAYSNLGMLIVAIVIFFCKGKYRFDLSIILIIFSMFIAALISSLILLGINYDSSIPVSSQSKAIRIIMTLPSILKYPVPLYIGSMLLFDKKLGKGIKLSSIINLSIFTVLIILAIFMA